MDTEIESSLNELRDDIKEINRSIRDLKHKHSGTDDRVEKIEQILLENDNVANRSGLEDLQMLRLVYERFQSIKFMAGLLTGVVAVGVALLKLGSIVDWVYKIVKTKLVGS